MQAICDFVAIIIFYFVCNRFFTPLLTKIDATCKKTWISILITVLLYLFIVNCLHFIFQIFHGKNIYQIFELSEYCSDTQLHKQFKKISKLYHPDRNPANADIYFKLGSYYDTLVNLKTRYMYDKFGIMSQTRPNSILADIFHGIFNTYRSMLEIWVVMIINFILRIKCSVSYVQFLTTLCLVTYLVFVKHSFGVFDILFPRMLPFEIVNILTSKMVYHVIYISHVIHFFQNKHHLILEQKRNRIRRYDSQYRTLQGIQAKMSYFRFRQINGAFSTLIENPFNRTKNMNGGMNFGNFYNFINIKNQD